MPMLRTSSEAFPASKDVMSDIPYVLRVEFGQLAHETTKIVGKPIANILLQKKEFANSIVTVCHSAAPDVSYYTKQADILIAAIGSANFVKGNMVKEGVVVIDVGINRVEDKSAKKGYRVVGDVDFNEVSKKASFITPVPGGVGPMTIAMLLKNTYEAYLKFGE